MLSIDERLATMAGPSDGGDWADVMGRVGGGAHRRRIVLAAVAVGAAALLATPALGLRGFVANLLGRIDVPFAGGEPAPTSVKAQFYDWNLIGPRSLALGVVASQTRRVATYREDGRTHVVYVAPARKGGFCWIVTRSGLGGCQLSASTRGAFGLRPINASWQLGAPSGLQWIGKVGGTLRVPAAQRLLARYADGSASDIRFYYVSKPINAGIFVFRVPDGHDTVATRLRAIEAIDVHGKVVAQQLFPYITPGRHVPPQAPPRPVPRRFLPKPIGDPSGPLQRARADGVSVVAGRNGVVVFDLSRLRPVMQALLAPGRAYYACVRRLPYHSELVDSGGGAKPRGNRVVMSMNSVRAPYDGCEIGGSYGHTWPDRFRSHAAVEVPFTSRGRRYFEERAAARDLAAFIRSQPFRSFRSLGGAELERALRASRYADELTRIDRIGHLYRTIASATWSVGTVRRSSSRRRPAVAFTSPSRMAVCAART